MKALVSKAEAFALQYDGSLLLMQVYGSLRGHIIHKLRFYLPAFYQYELHIYFTKVLMKSQGLLSLLKGISGEHERAGYTSYRLQVIYV